MLIDAALEFMSNKAITDDTYGDAYVPLGTTAAQGASTFIGAGAVGGNVAAAIGKGEPVFAYARVGTAFTVCTSIDVRILAADDNAGTNAVTLITKNFPLSALTANTFLDLGMLPGVGSGKVLSCQVVVNGSNAGAGTLTVGLRPDRDGFPQNDVFSAS
jgi:hypothetical protein